MVAAGGEILKVCAEVGGSISGEHGIGLEKADYMPLIFSEADLACMQPAEGRLQSDGPLQSRQDLPEPQGLRRGRPRLPPASDRREGPRPALLARAGSCRVPCSPARQAPQHRRRPARAHRASTARRTSSRAARPRPWSSRARKRRSPRSWRLAGEAGMPVMPVGRRHQARRSARRPTALGLVLGLKRLDRILEHEPGDLTATVEAGHDARRAPGRAGQARAVALARPARRRPRDASAASSRAMPRARAGISTAPRAIC